VSDCILDEGLHIDGRGGNYRLLRFLREIEHLVICVDILLGQY
jgi:hypothetical protein